MTLLLLAAALTLPIIPSRFPDLPAGPERNNPQAFHLWTTNGSFASTFTYDPRKTDHWRVSSAGGTPLLLPPLPGQHHFSPSVPTNPPPQFFRVRSPYPNSPVVLTSP